MASYLGYRDISVLGVDNTMFQGLSVTQENELMLGDKHFYVKQRPDQTRICLISTPKMLQVFSTISHYVSYIFEDILGI
jgi:hypothetical protein